MSSLGSVEPFVSVPTPREKVAMEYLQSAGRVLTRQQLRDAVACSHLLQTEFMVSLTRSFKQGFLHNWRNRNYGKKKNGQHFIIKVQIISEWLMRLFQGGILCLEI